MATCLRLYLRPGSPSPRFPFKFPRFPIWPGNGEGIPVSRFGRDRGSGNSPFPIRPGTGNGAPIGRKSGNRGYPPCETAGAEQARAGLDVQVALSPSNADLAPPPPPPPLLKLPRTGRWRMRMTTRRWRRRTMGRTFRTMSTQTLMPRHWHVHNKDPLSKYAHANFLQAHRAGGVLFKLRLLAHVPSLGS